MPRPKKDYQILNVKLDSAIMERFRTYCDIMGQPKTTALERILQKYLNDFEQSEEDRKLLSYGIPLSQLMEQANIKPEDLHGSEDVEIK